MDLIYTDSSRKDLGVLQGYKLDEAFGKDENDFEITTDLLNTRLQEDYFIYIEGTEARNSYELWIYPKKALEKKGVIIARDLNQEVVKVLENGGKTLLLIDEKNTL